MMEIPPRRDGEMRPIGEDRFVAPAMMITIDRQDGAAVGFTVDAGRVRGICFERSTGPG